MKTYSVYLIETGRFTGEQITTIPDQIECNVGEGFSAIEGRYHANQAIVDGNIVEVDPEPGWTWDHARCDFVRLETPQQAADRERKFIDAQRMAKDRELVVSFGGNRYQSDERSRRALAEALTAIGLGADPPRWRTKDNVDVELSPDDLRALFLCMKNAADEVYAWSIAAKGAL